MLTPTKSGENEELRELDVRRGKASMEWYRAMRARSRGEITWGAMIEAEARVRELDAELRRVYTRKKGSSS